MKKPDMYSRTTHDITVEVETAFIPRQSSLKDNYFFFAYRIHIQNHSEHTVKLLNRNWLITDGLGQVRNVEGIGVVGEQPIIPPGKSHVYTSGTNFPTPVGKMSGNYGMLRLTDKIEFNIEIPEFVMEFPVVMN